MVLAQSNSSSDTSPNAVDATLTEQPAQKNFSCVLCAQRKVKCDKRPGGCASCSKVRVACVYKAPPPPRRRKKGVRDVDVTTRLRVYEDALREFGVDPEELVRQEYAKSLRGQEKVTGFDGFLEPRVHGQARKTHLASEVGVLVQEKGKSRYLENGIWTSLTGEFRESKEILDDSSDEDVSAGNDGSSLYAMEADGGALVLGVPSSSNNLRCLHPSPTQIFNLWQAYLANINPLVKVLHAPTVQQLISDACSDLNDISRDVEALLFAIYCITVESLDDEGCTTMLGKPKVVLIQRFRQGAQQALTNANFLRSSSVMLLQAFTIFILSLQDYDARVIWIFSGIAQRIGQRIGLHRDGKTLQLPLFESEIRRRLWWQIMMLEGYSQKLAGTGTSGMILRGDVQMPSNVNDSDLFPGMREPPKEHEGPTEMMFFLIRCLVGDFLKRSAESHTTFDGLWHRLTTSAVQVATKDRAIDQLEALFQRKFLQYCDPHIPWHLMCMHLAKAIIFMMRFMAHSTDYYSVDMSQAEKDTLFDLALQVSVSQNLAYTVNEMRGFMWHVNLHFQWKAFIYLLSELRYRTEGAKVDEAWAEVEKSYESHPSFDKHLSRRALPVAVNNLTLKAWDAYNVARGMPTSAEPHFIQIIRLRMQQGYVKDSSGFRPHPELNTTSLSPDSHGNSNTVHDHDSHNIAVDEFAFDWDEFNASLGPSADVSDLMQFEFPEQMTWSTLDDLLVDFHDSSGFNAE